MPWGKMDDKFHRNPKVRDLRRLAGGREALGVWVYWWSWCLDDPRLTGFVPADELSKPDLKAAELLVSVGLWDVVDGGFSFHDFNRYNPTREKLDDKRTADRERVAAKRDASRENVARDKQAMSHATQTDVARDTDGCRTRQASDVAGESLPCAPARVPSRPVPSDLISTEREFTLSTTTNSPANDLDRRGGGFSIGAQDPGHRGMDWYVRLTALKSPDYDFNLRWYRKLGARTDAELDTVEASVRATHWCQQNWDRVTPKHIAGHLEEYLVGPRNFETRTLKPLRGAAPVSSRESNALAALSNPAYLVGEGE